MELLLIQEQRKKNFVMLTYNKIQKEINIFSSFESRLLIILIKSFFLSYTSFCGVNNFLRYMYNNALPF